MSSPLSVDKCDAGLLVHRGDPCERLDTDPKLSEIISARLEGFLDRMAENMKNVQESGDAELSAKQKKEQERLESI